MAVHAVVGFVVYAEAPPCREIATKYEPPYATDDQYRVLGRFAPYDHDVAFVDQATWFDCETATK